MSMRNKKNIGAVSLFIVIFSAVIIAILSISYARIAVIDQQQSSSSDLSQSAYDSALAGVEDAKRALSRYKEFCDNDPSNCSAQLNAIDSSLNPNLSCTSAVSTLGDVTPSPVDGEVVVSSDLNQAYTCVKINMQTPDYLGLLAKDESSIIPIIANSSVSRIKIEWFSQKDLTPNTTFANIPNVSNFSTGVLDSAWPANRPSLMRAQFVSLDSSGFSLSQLDGNGADTYSRAIFMYPSQSASSVSLLNLGSYDIRNSGIIDKPDIVRCSSSILSSGYFCSVTISLPSNKEIDDVMYLRLKAFYNKSNYKISLLNSANVVVNFNGVQPEIDSTGRADNLFRRVKARVSMSNVNFPYPEAAVDVTSSLCKNFWVTNTNNGDLSSGSCRTN